MIPNYQALQVAYGTVPVIVTILIALFLQNKRVDDLNKRFDDLNQRLDDLKDFIRSEIKRVEQRIDRLEYPVIRSSQ